MKFYVIDSFSVANKTGMGGRINTIMQTCFSQFPVSCQENERSIKSKIDQEDITVKRRESRCSELRASIQRSQTYLK
jgi:pyruvate-ferredoxin/flavodoxin oxidoreductase